MAEKDAVLLIVGIVALVIFFVSGVGVISYFIHQHKKFRGIRKDDERLRDDLVNYSQHPGDFPKF